MRRTATLSIGLLVAAAAGLAPAISAAPAPPAPAAKTAAQQARPFPAVAFYRGTRTSSAEAVSQAGACALVGGVLLCFDTEAQARAAGSLVVRRYTPRRDGGGVPQERCDPPAALYAAPNFDTSGGKRVLLLYDRGYWQSLVGSPFQFAGQTSSWKTGCAGGYLSIKGSGGTPKIGMAAGGQQATMPPGWDDRAAAVRRCPC